MTSTPTIDPGNTRIVNYPDVDGRTRSFYLLFSRHSDNAIAEVLADNNYLHAFIAYRRTKSDHVVTAAELQAVLRHASVTVGIDATSLEVLAELVNAGRPPVGPFPVAKGEAPTPGENSYVEYHVQPTADEARYDTAQDGTIDYRELNLIENCFAGQLVATIHPPGEGRPGRDIHGRMIRAFPGNPVTLIPGVGITLNPAGTEFAASLDGRLEVRAHKLQVVQEYVIPGDVDYRVGNIDFVGRVVVRGGVLDGFRVSGKLGVAITGACGACEVVSSDGDVTLSGGVKGRSAAVIRAGGKVKARYLDECVVEAKGDVVVDREIINCTIRTTGRLLIPNGNLVGGDATALWGATVGVVGSSLGVATRVAVGLNWTDEATLLKIEGELADAIARATTAKHLLEPFFADTVGLAKLSVADKTQISDLAAELGLLRREVAGLLEERETVQTKKKGEYFAVLNVKQRIFNESTVQFPSFVHRVRETVKGPTSFACPDTRSGVKTGSVVELPEPVAESVIAPEPPVEGSAKISTRSVYDAGQPDPVL